MSEHLRALAPSPKQTPEGLGPIAQTTTMTCATNNRHSQARTGAKEVCGREGHAIVEHGRHDDEEAPRRVADGVAEGGHPGKDHKRQLVVGKVQ